MKKLKLLAAATALAYCSGFSLTGYATDVYIQRISVVDYDTKELIQFDDDQEYSISFHAGHDVEYVLTDGTFAWGTMWDDASEWDYNAQNPYVINALSYADDYEIIDIDLPDGYFLPDDYLETIEYDNASTDIYIKLKKTLSGDVNDDGEFSVLDVILFQKWLLSIPNTHLENWKAADFNHDGVLNVFDLLLMKKALTEVKPSESQPVLLSIYENYAWMPMQAVQVYDQYGRSYEVKQSYHENDFYQLTSDAWYTELCDIIRTNEPDANREFSSEVMNEVNQYIRNIDQHQDCQMSDSVPMMEDGGIEKLYMIYQDDQGNPYYQLLSQYGDYCAWQECGDVQHILKQIYPHFEEVMNRAE